MSDPAGQPPPHLSQEASEIPLPGSSRRRTWIVWLLKLGFAALVLALIFREVPLGRVIEALGGARSLPVIAAVLLLLFSTLCSAQRLRIAGKRQGLSMSAWRIAAINLAATFYGLFLPGYLAGGAIRWYKLSAMEKGRPGILAAMVYSRLNYLVVLILLGALFLLVDLRFDLEAPALRGLLVLLGGALAIHLVGFRGMALRAFDSFERRFGGSRSSRRASRLRGLLETASQYRTIPARDRAAVWGMSLAENVLGILSVYLLVASLDLPVSFANSAWVRSAILLVTAVPVSIAGLGIREGGLIVLLEPAGVDATSAVALSFLMLFRTICLGALGAAVELRGGASRPSPGQSCGGRPTPCGPPLQGPPGDPSP